MRTPRAFTGSALFVLGVAAAAAGGCTKPTPTIDTTIRDAAASFDETTIARAEDARRARDVPADLRTSHDVTARRRSARALARIADAESVDGLATLLTDEDPETIAWAAYGLGQACKGREDAHVRLLSARAASLPPPPPAPAPAGATTHGTHGRSALDPRTAIARAIGRCPSPLSEQVLISLLTSSSGSHEAWRKPALLGLGDLATRRKQLGAEAMTALLDTAGNKTSPNDDAFFPLSRVESGAFGRRVVEVSLGALGRRSEARIFAIRALGKAGKDTAKDAAATLAKAVVDEKGFDEAERAEAARALGALAEPGQAALAGAVETLTPDARDPIGIDALLGRRFNVVYTIIGQLGVEPPKTAEAALSVLASLAPAAEPPPNVRRRLGELRCASALALARGTYDAELLLRCADESSEASQRARLSSLLRRPLVRERLAVLRTLSKSEHLRVREAVVEALGAHPETGEAAIPILADALASKHAGLVAVAAELLAAQPERALVLAPSERRAALDPKVPPPTSHPERVLAAAVGRALAAAIAEPWPEDRFETRIALVEAAAALHLDEARDLALAGCRDPNPVLRERASKALRALGADVASCSAAAGVAKLAPELDSPITKPVRAVFTTDSAELSISLEPDLSPITAARIAALVRSGFYKGIVVHRVVPGFVAQLGDPDGDGYGGGGTSLRCETSPVPFERLDVGMALAGRDTGSSQFFVTLARTPHLDGEYTRVGRASGDWASVAQGDVITDARIVE